MPLIVAFVILALYTYTSGLRAPAMIAFVKDIMIYIVVIAAVWLIPSKLGGYAHVFDAADAFFKAKGGATGIILKPTQFTAYASLALGSALAAFMYPHTMTAVLSSSSAATVRKNAIFLPAYTLLLGLIALLGYMAIASGIKVHSASDVVPALFGKLFPSWFVGFAAAAIAISALVPAAIMSIAGTIAMAAFFGIIALRATGLGFLMITLALSQVLWGLAYRMSDVTNGDNGIAGLTRPMPFGISLDSPASFYWFALIVALSAFLLMAIFVSSSFGSSLKGVRDQPRRMAALGFNPWMIRWITFIYSGFWGGVSGLLYVYYNKYIHPSSLSTTSSAEALLGVIAGGSGTLGGPAVGAALVLLLKNYASAYIERWNMLLGLVFLFIVLVMPTGIVPGLSKLVAVLRRGAR